MLRDKALVSAVLLVFVRVVFAYHRCRARQRGIAGGQTGAVTAIQRVGSFANANLHFHTLIPEGVWHERPDGSLGFHSLPPPTDEDVQEINARIVAKIRGLLARRDGDAVDDEPDALAYAQAEAARYSDALKAEPLQEAVRRLLAFAEVSLQLPQAFYRVRAAEISPILREHGFKLLRITSRGTEIYPTMCDFEKRDVVAIETGE